MISFWKVILSRIKRTFLFFKKLFYQQSAYCIDRAYLGKFSLRFAGSIGMIWMKNKQFIRLIIVNSFFFLRS